MERLRDGEAKCPIKITATGWEIRDVRSALMPRIMAQSHPESCCKHLFHRDVLPLLHSAKLLKALLASLQAPFPIHSRSAGLVWALEGHPPAPLWNGASVSGQMCSLSQTLPLPGSDVRQGNSPSESQFPHLQNGTG